MSMNETSKQLAKLPAIHSQFFKKYRNFADDVWQKGMISSRDKEIIAVAVTTVTKCSYCTKFHTKKARIAGVTTKELVEGVIVASSIETGTALLPSISIDIFQNIGVENQAEQLSELFPDQHTNLQELLIIPFEKASGVLSERLIILISYAAAHALRSTEYIEKVRDIAKEYAVTEIELGEASLIAAALRAGSTVKHVADILEIIDKERG